MHRTKCCSSKTNGFVGRINHENLFERRNHASGRDRGTGDSEFRVNPGYLGFVIVISMVITALLMSVNYFPAAFHIIIFTASLMTGIIIEFMFSGDNYE